MEDQVNRSGLWEESGGEAGCDGRTGGREICRKPIRFWDSPVPVNDGVEALESVSFTWSTEGFGTLF